jgi:hypothetical protein
MNHGLFFVHAIEVAEFQTNRVIFGPFRTTLDVVVVQPFCFEVGALNFQ